MPYRQSISTCNWECFLIYQLFLWGNLVYLTCNSYRVDCVIVSLSSIVADSRVYLLQGRYELSHQCGRSSLSIPDLWHNFTFSFMSLALSFKIQTWSCYIIEYVFRFDSPIWTLKSDIIWGCYELSDSHGRSLSVLAWFL